MNCDVYVSHYQQIKEGWGSLTKRTPKMKLQQAFILSCSGRAFKDGNSHTFVLECPPGT